MKVEWTWDYEIRDLGRWPTRPPYVGHNEPVAVVRVEALKLWLQCQSDFAMANRMLNALKEMP